MKIWAWALSALYRLPKSSDLVAHFSLREDDAHSSVELRLERVLQESLSRRVAVIPADRSADYSMEKVGADGAWSVDRRAIDAWLERAKVGAIAATKLKESFGSIRNLQHEISVLVPMLSSTGTKIATVVVGKRRFLPLVAPERELIATAVGMAALLLHQEQLRNALSVITAQTEAVKGVVESHRQVVQRYLRVDERRLN